MGMATPDADGSGTAHIRLLRDRRGPHPVTPLELFFDLVYVFAVTQLSHGLLAQLTWLGAFQTLLLLLAVWWVWIYTAWFTSLVDADHPAVRLVVLALMFASLVMSVALPEAFGAGGPLFVAAYLAIQCGHMLFLLLALRGHPLQRLFARILFTFGVSAVPWIAGAVVASGMARALLWTLAIGFEYVQSTLGYPMPRIGRSRVSDRMLAGRHWAERCQQFVLIALGESLLVIGATVGAGLFGLSRAGMGQTLAFIVAFGGVVAMWWIVFYRTDARAAAMIAAAAEPGRLARLYGYTYVVLVAGILVLAVGNALLLAYPFGRLELAWLVVLLGGPALFVAGHMLFERALIGQLPPSHLGALCVLAVLAVLAPVLLHSAPLIVAAATTAVLIGTAAAHTIHQRAKSVDAVAIAASTEGG